MTELILAVIGASIVSISVTYGICYARTQDLMDYMYDSNILIDRSRLDPELLKDWVEGKSRLGLRFIYKDAPIPTKLRIVKNEITYEDKGDQE